MKKILSQLMSFVIIFYSLGFNAVCTYADPSSETQESEKARIVFGETNTFEKADIKLTGNQTKTAISGKFAIALGANDASHNMGVDVDDSFIYAPEGTSVKISVEYLDKGKGKFSISYDGINNKSGITDAEEVSISDTGEWKVHEFILDDIKCTNGLGGSDFRVATRTNSMGTTSEPVYISSVTVARAFPGNPVEVSGKSGHTGNIFGETDDKKMTVNFKNVYQGDVKVQVEYQAINSENKILDNGNFEFTLENEKEYEYVIDLNKCIKFDTYKLELDIRYSALIDNEECESKVKEAFNFSVANKSNANEKNKKLRANGNLKYLDDCLTLVDEGGFYGVRYGAYWPCYEQTKKGVYDGDGYGGHKGQREYNEALFADSGELNMSNILNIIGGNPLYEPNRFVDAKAAARPEIVVPTTDEAIKGYANFCAYVAKRYAGTFDTIEIWNEYNNANFNYYVDDAETYTKLLKAAYTAVKAVDPNITVIGLSPAYDPDRFKDFIEGVLKNGGYDYMDAVSIHPYDGADPGYRITRLKRLIEQYKDMFKPYGEPKPIIMTEIGSSTSSDQWGTTESRQAANYVRICTYAFGESLVESIAWYNLIDTGDQDQTEHRWGLVHSATCGRDAFTAKPSYIAATALNKMLHDTEIANKLINDDKQIFAYDFKGSNDEHTAVIWSENGQETLGLSLGTNEIQLYDINSNLIGTMTSEDGTYSIATDINAVYVKGGFSKFEEVNADISYSNESLAVVPGDMVEINLTDSKKRDLNVELDMPEDVEITGNSYDANSGVVKINVKMPEDAKESYTGDIRLYDEDNLVYATKLNFNIADPITAAAISSQISKTDPNHWQTEVYIKNNSYGLTMSGTCKLIKVGENAMTTNTAAFNNLKGKETVTLYLNLPEMIKKRTTEIVYEIETSNGEKRQYTQNVDFSQALYCNENKPKIDGNIEQGEWLSAWSTVDRETDMHIAAGGKWNGKNDLSYELTTMWDEENFYMAAVVKDDVHCQNEDPGNMWKGDGIQIGLESDINKYGVAMLGNTDLVYGDFTEIGIALNGTNAYAYRFSSQRNRNPVGVIDNCEVSVSRADQKTIYEVAIPWTEIFGADYTIKSGDVLKFAAVVNDNDGSGRKLFGKYNDGIGGGKDAYKFGNLSCKNQ